MRKRISLCFVFVFFLLTVCSCQRKNILLFLNWGEYVDEAMIEEFEKMYNCEVLMDLGESNELFYSKVSAGTTCYDVVCPSDYMVLKMAENNMLRELDFSRLPNYNKEDRMPGVKGIAEALETKKEGITNYYVPYLWGTWGIAYSTLKDGLKESVTTAQNEWASLFDRNSLPAGTRVAMYDSNLHSYYAACRYLGLDTEKTLSKTELNQISNLIKGMHYDAWGTDDIKKDIVAGNRDVGFMWTGDFLYYYCENTASTVIDAYLAGDVTIDEISSMIETITTDAGVYKEKYQVGFDIFIPSDTIAFCDNLVIPKQAAHYDLALEFINFMCGRDEGENHVDPAFANTYYVSYNAPYMSLYEDIVGLKDAEFTAEDVEGLTASTAYDSDLYWKIYDVAIGIAFEKYYPKEENITLPDGSIKRYKGDILATFPRNYINTINSTFNNAKA
ncbi:MAG: extracellular solute-binding protein [Anaeroplasmataceae bacterium]|nr:extracellular solute-binding protein [Anaeroplasmataceae bacterium]